MSMTDWKTQIKHTAVLIDSGKKTKKVLHFSHKSYVKLHRVVLARSCFSNQYDKQIFNSRTIQGISQV